MFPFPHKHDWSLVTTRHGPAEHPQPGMTTWTNYDYWQCSCGEFLITIGGREHVRITGRIPEPLRGKWSSLARWMDQWLPKCKELEGEESCRN